MNIKTFIAAAVISLTAACTQAEEAQVDAATIEAEADEVFENEEDNQTNSDTVSQETTAG